MPLRSPVSIAARRSVAAVLRDYYQIAVPNVEIPEVDGLVLPLAGGKLPDTLFDLLKARDMSCYWIRRAALGKMARRISTTQH